MTPNERAAVIARRSRDERVLIYSNLLNNVPVFRVMEVFRKSEKEVMDIFRSVSRTLTEYCFERKLPPVPCEAITVAQRSKRILLPLLVKVNLDKQPAFSRIRNEKINPGNAMGVLGEMTMKASI